MKIKNFNRKVRKPVLAPGTKTGFKMFINESLTVQRVLLGCDSRQYLFVLIKYLPNKSTE